MDRPAHVHVRQRLPRAATAQRERGRIERLIRALFDFYRANPPISLVAGASEADRVTDYLAGMTDRFALRAFEELSLPRGF